MAVFICIFSSFIKNKAGAGTIEFALIAPVLFILYIGLVDTTRAIVLSQKVQNATVSVNDLVSQATELTRESVLKTFGAADAILASSGVGLLNMRVTAVNIDAAGNAKVAWSVVRGMERIGVGRPYAVSSSLNSLRSYTLIVTESKVDFSPLSELVIGTKIPLAAHSQGRFRGRKAVTCADCTN